jgi:TRAP-type C4-dicarboxylate transport system permease small subunit
MILASGQPLRRESPAGAFLRLLGTVELAIAAAAFLVVCVVVSVNALLRFGFNSSIVWSEEVALLATNVFVFLGAAVILKANADVAVIFVVERLSARTRALALMTIYTAASVFFATLLWQSIALWPLQLTTSTFILDISRFWFTVPLVWAAASMLLTSVVFVFDTAADMLRNRQSVGPRRYLTLPAEPE